MTVISKPKTTFNIEPPSLEAGITPHKVLLVGVGTTGTFTDGALVPNIIDVASAEALACARSMFANAFRAFRGINKITQVDGIVLTELVGGVNATASITVTGTATESKDLEIYIASEHSNKITVTIASGDVLGTVATKIAAAITADAKVPVTASATLGVVTITAANKGTMGNSIGIKVVGSVAGVSLAVVGMTGGAGNPVTTATLDVLGDDRYQTIIWDASLDLDVLTDFLDARFNVENDVQDGVGLATVTDTFANLGILLNTFNSQNMVILCRELNSITNSEYVLRGGDVLEWNPMHTAQVAALRSLRLTDGANIVALLTGATGLDGRGGAALASRPYFNTPVKNMELPEVGVGFSTIESDQLKALGGSLLGANRARTGLVLGEMVTTYKTNGAGDPDISYKYLNYVDTVSIIREYFWNNFKSRFAQSRLTLGDLVEGRPMANENSVRAFAIGLYGDLSGSDFALTQQGEEALKAFRDNLLVTIDLAQGLVICNCEVVPIVTQYRETFGKIKFAFNPSAA